MNTNSPDIPQATVHAKGRKGWWMLLPVAVAICTIFLVYRSLYSGGILITLDFPMAMDWQREVTCATRELPSVPLRT